MAKRFIAATAAAAVLGSIVVVSQAQAADVVGRSCAKAGRTSSAADGTRLVCSTVNKKRQWRAQPASTTAAPTTAAVAVTAPVATDKDLKGAINIDGSSTVFPLSEAAAELFQKEIAKNVRVTVGESGTGGGFKKFCAGEIDIADASRPITDAEKKACGEKGIKYAEFTIANDGLALVVNPSNNFAACLTVAQLKKIWDGGSKVNNWREVDELFPNLGMKLFGAGTASGTFDYFSEAVNGRAKQHRSDYNATEDDNVTVVGVASSPGGLGYFGLSYALENSSRVKLVSVDNNNGKCVTPSAATVLDGSYKPLGRPLFIYVSAKSLQQPHIERFVEFYLDKTDDLAKRALFVPLSAPQKTTLKAQLADLKNSAKNA